MSLLAFRQTVLMCADQVVSEEKVVLTMCKVVSLPHRGEGGRVGVGFLNACIISNGKISVYANDIVLYQIICSPMDYILLQQDVDSICAWVDQNLLLLNTLKCCYLLFVKEHVGLNQKPCQYWRGLGVSQFNYWGIVNSHGRRTARQQWLTYPAMGEAPLPVRNWIVHIQVVRNNAVNVPFQKLS